MPATKSAAQTLVALSDPTLGLSLPLATLLKAIRNHLQMDVAFVSEIIDGKRVYRAVDVATAAMAIAPGDSLPADESYCIRVIDGRLPELITDAGVNAEALTMAMTTQFPVGAHLSVPIRLTDGRTYGALCCFSRAPEATLGARDLAVMRAVADAVAVQLARDIDLLKARQLVDDRLTNVLTSDGLQMVYQPIYELASHRVAAFECLARFASTPYRPPDQWFAEAALVGRQVELEMAAIRLALQSLHRFPSDIYLTVNASPNTIVSGNLEQAFEDVPLDRVVLEVTEHEAVERYEDLASVIRPLQDRGLRIAIDDAGAGHSSFRHVLNLQPQIVKLDVSITRGIDADRSRRALAAALCGFAAETGCKMVAEGIETAEELAVIRRLGIRKAQGYFLGKPMKLADALALCEQPRPLPQAVQTGP